MLISLSNYFLQQQTLQHNLRCAEDEIEKLDCYIEEMREVRHVFTSPLTSRSSKLWLRSVSTAHFKLVMFLFFQILRKRFNEVRKWPEMKRCWMELIYDPRTDPVHLAWPQTPAPPAPKTAKILPLPSAKTPPKSDTWHCWQRLAFYYCVFLLCVFACIDVCLSSKNYRNLLKHKESMTL